uniref:Uncharacterized protein n=1 Tax=Gossypium raimondii TaxID=29730 RepID=A0A0D2VGB4_GOSRA|nr:hypothetical protein B456_013G202300 [Gossypium raimondii]
MAGYGYAYRGGYTTYNGGVAPRGGTEGWNKTSYSSDHTCQPVFIDAEGRRKPITSYTGPQGSTEYYVTKTEIVELPYMAERKQRAPVRVEVVRDYGEGKLMTRPLSPGEWRESSSPVRYHTEEKWNKPSRPVQYDVEEKWNKPSSPVRYRVEEKWNKPSILFGTMSKRNGRTGLQVRLRNVHNKFRISLPKFKLKLADQTSSVLSAQHIGARHQPRPPQPLVVRGTTRVMVGDGPKDTRLTLANQPATSTLPWNT